MTAKKAQSKKKATKVLKKRAAPLKRTASEEKPKVLPGMEPMYVKKSVHNIRTPRYNGIVTPLTTKNRSMTRPALHVWLTVNMRLLTITGGTLVVILWTLLRHISNGINFDVVGQIGLAQQWAQGQMVGAQLGATHYLFKMPVYYLFNNLTWLTPMNRILILALICNVATFTLLFILYEKITNLYQIKNRSWLYVLMAWLATIMGNVFWVDYANSRNLETVGGVLFLYLVMKFIHEKRPTTLIAISLWGSVIFFADSLQLYVVGAGVCLFAFVRLILRGTKNNAWQALALICATVVGYSGAHLLSVLSRKLLAVTFLSVPNMRPDINLPNIVASLHGAVVSTMTIFGAYFLKKPYGANNVREAVNAVLLVLVIALLVKHLPKVRNISAAVLILAVIFANYFVYITSGQALQFTTSRYLIMVPLLITAAIALCGDELAERHAQKIQYTALILIGLSTVMLLGALVTNWPNRHSKDGHIQETITFMHQNHFTYALASREVGITTTYFSKGDAHVLPMGCEANHTLRPTSLFYDKQAFKDLSTFDREVPIIVSVNGINFGRNTCSKAAIVAQFGTPKREQVIQGVGSAMVYEASSLRTTEIDELVGAATQHHVLKPASPNSGSDQHDLDTRGIAKLQNCKNGKVMVVVAHPDDDILFMNPALAKQAGNKCMRSIYVTAADDGRSPEYWKKREQGIEAAYAFMLEKKNTWMESTVTIDGHVISERKLANHPSVGLIFLRLPDGNIDGKGFAQTGHHSLKELASHHIESLKTVDGSTSYTYQELLSAISDVIQTDMPSVIYTTIPSGKLSIGDHSDHREVGHLTLAARSKAMSNASVSLYVGYPSTKLPQNLSIESTNQKKNIFFMYAQEDGAICTLNSTCSTEATYQNYFSRSYKIDKYQHTSGTR